MRDRSICQELWSTFAGDTYEADVTRGTCRERGMTYHSLNMRLAFWALIHIWCDCSILVLALEVPPGSAQVFSLGKTVFFEQRH